MDRTGVSQTAEIKCRLFFAQYHIREIARSSRPFWSRGPDHS